MRLTQSKSHGDYNFSVTLLCLAVSPRRAGATYLVKSLFFFLIFFDGFKFIVGVEGH